MDFQKELKILSVTDFWQKKVTCRLNVLPPFREDGVTEQHDFFWTRWSEMSFITILPTHMVVKPIEEMFIWKRKEALNYVNFTNPNGKYLGKLRKSNNILSYFLILQPKFREKLLRICHRHCSQFWPYNIHHKLLETCHVLTQGDVALFQTQCVALFQNGWYSWPW